MDSQSGGIYQIRNTVNGKRYIGSTNCFKTRWKGHRSKLRRGIHGNPHLQSAWNKYGESSFQFLPLETVEDKSKLLSTEQRWLDTELVFAPHGYNINRLAKGQCGFSHTQDWKDKVSASLRGRMTWECRKSFVITSPDGTEHTVLGLSQFCRNNGLSAPALSETAHGKRYSHKGWRARLI